MHLKAGQINLLEEAVMVTTRDGFGTTTDVPYASRAEGGLVAKRISWAAVIAAVIIALAIQLVLDMIGAGVGFSAIDPLQRETLRPLA